VTRLFVANSLSQERVKFQPWERWRLAGELKEFKLQLAHEL
jgi:hypothetical protein